ncbi:F0F1 ATP synthase subunit A [Brevibacillus daliensis]|uniref:F0F1 ATP synthase subunit A n=1 Tax=Brevibacillus daliensis TaxID=2892995 RepID=UPI001E6419D8|nr:F0F1 ATP synthase subunit A [Brevibacillus daliensis]
MVDHFTYRFQLGPLVFDLATIIMIVVTALVVFIMLVAMTRNLTAGVPRGTQNVLEWIVDFVAGIVRSFMDTKTAARFVTLAVTLFLYIILGNWLGLAFNVLTVHTPDNTSSEFIHQLAISSSDQATAAREAKIMNAFEDHSVHVAWWKSPTATASVTFTLALTVLLYSQWIDIRRVGVGKYFKHFLNPIHLLEELVIKPLTLPLRLFGNIFAGEVLISFLLSASIFISTIPLIIWLGYSVFVGAIQAYIFTTLTMVYISQKLSDGH